MVKNIFWFLIFIGSGTTKKIAENQASRLLLEYLESVEPVQ